MKAYPSNVRILVAEDIREEVGGKHTLLGIFGGDDIQFVRSSEMAEAAGPSLPSLVIYVIFSGGEGEYATRVELLAPSKGKIVGAPPFPTKKDASTNLILMAKFLNVPFPESGDYAVRVWLDDHEYQLKLKVVESRPTAAEPLSAATTISARPRAEAAAKSK